MLIVKSLLLLIYVALAYINHLRIKKGMSKTTSKESLKAWKFVRTGNFAMLVTLIIWFVYSAINTFIHQVLQL